MHPNTTIALPNSAGRCSFGRATPPLSTHSRPDFAIRYGCVRNNIMVFLILTGGGLWKSSIQSPTGTAGINH
jgi:hypothetical protein